MASPSVPKTAVAGNTALAADFNSNFSAVLAGLGGASTWDISALSITSLGALTIAGATILNGAITLGNATGDDITVNGRFASDLDPKTSAANDIGSTSQAWQALYLDNAATDGGAIYFDAGSSEFIKATSDGTQLDIDGFTTVDVDAVLAAASISSGDIDPSAAASKDIGDTTNTWRALYVDNTATDGGAIYFDGGSAEYLKANAAGTILDIGGFTTLEGASAGITLGAAAKAFKAIYLDNTATDSGAIYFDAGSAEYIKGNAAGTQLDIGGFTGIRSTAVKNLIQGWMYGDGNAAVDSYNVASVGTGTGVQCVVTWDTNFAAAPCVTVTPEGAAGTGRMTTIVGNNVGNVTTETYPDGAAVSQETIHVHAVGVSV